MSNSKKILKEELVKVISEILFERGFSEDIVFIKSYVSRTLENKIGRMRIKKLLQKYKSPYFKFTKKYNFDDLIVFIDLIYEIG